MVVLWWCGVFPPASTTWAGLSRVSAPSRRRPRPRVYLCTRGPGHRPRATWHGVHGRRVSTSVSAPPSRLVLGYFLRSDDQKRSLHQPTLGLSHIILLVCTLFPYETSATQHQHSLQPIYTLTRWTVAYTHSPLVLCERQCQRPQRAFNAPTTTALLSPTPRHRCHTGWCTPLLLPSSLSPTPHITVSPSSWQAITP